MRPPLWQPSKRAASGTDTLHAAAFGTPENAWEFWEPEPNLATSAESWITAGDPQHTELSTAAEIHQLVDFGNLLTVDLLIIDGATDRRDVAVRIE